MQQIINDQDKFKQKLEDLEVDHGIKSEALRLFQEWLDAPIIKCADVEFRNYICVVSPFITSYIVHDENSAKYLDKNINKLVIEEFNKLKSESNIED